MKPETILRKSKTWKEYKSHLSSLTNKEKGDSFEALSKYYFQLDPRYATKLKHVWDHNKGEVPPAVSKKLNLPGSDEGIDLLAQTKEGEYWAIQCKYREDESHSLSRKELSTFTDLAFTICEGIDLALVCTTADRFSHKLKMYGDRLTFCAGDEWRRLDSGFFIGLHKHLAGKVVPLTPLMPRKHQQEAVENAVQHFKTDRNARGKMIMPCGTGKSLTGYWIADALNARKILVAVPSLSLVKQTLEVWTRESIANGTEVNWICVCSDETVKDVGDDASVFVQDLGVHVHTDPEEIAAWLKKRKTGRTVVFTTYQSGKAIAEASRLSGTVFDLGIMDEAHKTVGRKDSTFAWLLSDENIKIKKRTFMTATERRYAGSSDQLVSMDDPEIYGDTFELLSFKSALEAKPPILSDYKIITIGITSEEVEALLDKNVLVQPDKGKWDERLEAEMLAGAVALRKAIKKHPIKHAVSFHSSIARAVAFKQTQDSITQTFPEFGELDSFHVSGKVPTSVRSNIMDEFEASDRALVTNARCLTEGVDVPNIDCIIFADPKKSQVDIVQAVGRALRPSDGKKYGYILIPVLIEGGASEIGQAQKTVFDTVLTTLKALASNDERIVEYFRSTSEGKQRRSGDRVIDIDVPIGMQIDSKSFLESIELHLWSRLAKLSWRPFKEARSFVRTLDLKNQREWGMYYRGELPWIGIKPKDIPAAPWRTYSNEGWVGWSDWLGTSTVAPQLRNFRSFKEAREFTRGLDLKNRAEWSKYCKSEMPGKGNLPEDIPASPWRIYRYEGWKGLGDWLGTGTIAPFLRKYRSFEKARKFVRAHNLKNGEEWIRYCKGELLEKGDKPSDIPATPKGTYANQGWVSMGDWLGTDYVAHRFRKYLSFNKARSIVRALKLKNSHEWEKYCKGEIPRLGSLPDDIPSSPGHVYKDLGWEGMGDWLGTGNVAPYLRRFRPFEEAREFARGLDLKSATDWKKFYKGELPEKGALPEDIPASPGRTYKELGWKGMGDWLGTGTIAPFLRKYRSFEEARRFTRSLGLTSYVEWIKYGNGELPEKGNLPEDIPAYPNKPYKDQGWIGYGDWLDTSSVTRRLREYRPFNYARKFVRRLNLKNATEWTKFCRGELPGKEVLPDDIPASPRRIYSDEGWAGLGDWLGTGTTAPQLREYRTFKEARRFARELDLKSGAEWTKFCKGELSEKGTLPDDIPVAVWSIYKNKGWKGMPDWLGTDKKKK